MRKPALLKQYMGEQFKLTKQRSFLLFFMQKLFQILGELTVVHCRSQWPRSLRHELVFAVSNAAIVGSNLTQGMDV
jgi:hypothetical protein